MLNNNLLLQYKSAGKSQISEFGLLPMASTSAGLGQGPGSQGSWSAEMENQDPYGGGRHDGTLEQAGVGAEMNGADKKVNSSAKRGLSWAERLGCSIPTSLNKNILEVVLEKDVKGPFFVTEEDCARLLRKLGLDSKAGVQVEGVQICPGGKGVIFITLKDGVRGENFCRYDVFELTADGIRSIMVKPAGKREVVVTLKGVHPNTRDNTVLDYLSKFGKIVSTKAVHGTYISGPLQGIKNGDRSYKLEVKPGENIGSFHVIEGQRVSLRYPGQQQTCGRCHQTPQNCVGKGIARRCQAEGGEKVEFTDYILDLWKKIGYSPQNSETAVDDIEDLGEEAHDAFTPAKLPAEHVFGGITIKHIPKETDSGEVIEFLCKNGLPADKTDNVLIRPNGTVIVNELENGVCKALIVAIHGYVNFGKKLFCNGIVPLSPVKLGSDGIPKSSNSEKMPPSPALGSLPKQTPAVTVACSTPPTTLAPSCPPSSLSATSLSTPSACIASGGTLVQEENREFIRRHSLSLMNRTPPKGSLAGEILAMTPRPDLNRTKSLVSELRDCLSDFGSCIESSDNDGGNSVDNKETSDEAHEEPGQLTLNEKKRMKKSKRKSRETPTKEMFLKRPNLLQSPTQLRN